MANKKLKIEKLKRKMYELEEDLNDSQNYGVIMTPYGDLMTLLLVFFVFLCLQKIHLQLVYQFLLQ
jgi:flagellar motor protein MotB